MRIANSPISAREYRARAERPVILVPTMGALHEGHAALVRCARKLAGKKGSVAVSVFVNPIQFGPKEDFSKYPRSWTHDLKICRACGADLVFRPSVEQMYRDDRSVFVDREFALALSLRCVEAWTFPRSMHGGCQVVPNSPPGYWHLRGEGLAATGHHSPNGARPGFSRPNRRASHHTGAGRFGDEFAKRVSDGGRARRRAGHLCRAQNGGRRQAGRKHLEIWAPLDSSRFPE